MRYSRRAFVHRSAALVAGTGLTFAGAGPVAAERRASTGAAEQGDGWHGLKVGVATYTFRNLSREQTIRAMERLDLRYVSIKDFHAPFDVGREQRREAGAAFRRAGITPLSCGVWRFPADEGRIRAIFDYARDLGVSTVVCQPAVAALPLLERVVREYDMRAAIHNHGPGAEWASPYDVWGDVANFDPRIGLCIDVGHTVRAGVDPAEAILRTRERLYDVHLKDNDRRGPESTDAVVGRGVVDVTAIMSALLQIGFTHHVGFEFELDPDDPLPGLAESVGYVRAATHHLTRRSG
jgi:inosose dehydratase